MYNRMIKKICYSGLIVFVLVTQACQKKADTNINIAKPAILEYIGQNKSLSILNAAVKRVQLDTAMSSGGPYTFFAPDDSAFIAAGLTLDSLNRMDTQKLLLLLKYHIVLGRISSDDLAGMVKEQVISLHPTQQPFISKNYYGIFFNGIAIVNPNLEMGDGVVQVINAISIPPAGSQLNVIEQQPDLTFFAALIHSSYTLRLLLGNPNPYSSYNGLSTYNNTYQLSSFGNTVLAPTDSAFRAFGYADSNAVAKDTLRWVNGFSVSVPTYIYYSPFMGSYLFNGFDFTCDFMGSYQISGSGSTVRFRAGGQSLYTSVDGLSFNGTGIALSNPVRIIVPNMVATNGVVQKINQVFYQ